jgi:hypothetical protein
LFWIRTVEGIGLVIVRSKRATLLIKLIVCAKLVFYPLATPRGVSEEVPLAPPFGLSLLITGRSIQLG